jgi:CTP:molybdopterin cytidylyltransferase MocA
MSALGSITAILVGGRETKHLRLPKQILPFGDTTVLGRTLAAYRGAGLGEIILVLGYKSDVIAEGLGPLPPGVRIVKNPFFEEGMGSFLRAGVRELGANPKGFCIGLGDQPLLTADLVKGFAEAFLEAKSKILVPAYQGSLGLPAFFPGNVAEEIASLPPSGELWDILKRHGADLIDAPTGFTAVVRSIEDTDDYHSMLKIAGLPIPELPAPAPPAAPPEAEAEEGATAEGAEDSIPA